MKKVIVSGNVSNSTILLGEKIKNFTKYIKSANKIIIITDTNVNKLYGSFFNQFPVIIIKPNESSKSLNTVNKIISTLIELEADRNSFIVGIGGGIVCDISGFVASIYMRGIRFGFVSTTLLSQVDASIGGKNGVNYKGFKNIIGVFNQPEFVICDFELLKTLPKRELYCGFAEIIKHALIADFNLIEFLEKNSQKALILDKKIIEHLVSESIRIKSEIIKNDERENGERRKLNFGHTIGHAIEKNSRLNHGEAVAVGMTLAILYSNQKKLISNDKLLRAFDLIEQFQLPTYFNFHKKQIIDSLKKDKKKDGGFINFIFLNDLGKSKVVKTPIIEIEDFINRMFL